MSAEPTRPGAAAPPTSEERPGRGGAARGDPADGAEPVDLTRQDLSRPALMMAVGTGLSRLTGLARVAAAAFALGVAESRLADSYNIANTLPNNLYELVMGGVLSSVFIPVLVSELRTRDRDEAWRAVSALVGVSVAVLVAVSALAVLAAPWIIDLFSARLSGTQSAQQHELATFFFRFFAPQVALYGLVAIAEGLLNAHGRFAMPMFVPILNNLVVIATFLAFAALSSGVPTNQSVLASSEQKLVLALGTTGGVAVMAASLWPFLRQLPGRLRLRLDFRHPIIRRVARLSAWTLVYVATNSIGFIVSFYLANGVQGGPTAYVTAFAFFQLPIGVAAISILSAITPRLSAHHVDRDADRFRSTVTGGLRTIALLMLPATVAYLVLAPALIQTLLQHGVVRAASADFVTSVLRMFSIGLLPYTTFLLFTRGFYVRQDARTPALINVVENGVTIAFDLALFPFLKVEGLALAHTLGYVAGSALAGMLLARRIGGLQATRTLGQLARMVTASAACAAAMVAAVWAVGALAGEGHERALAQLVAGAAVGAVVFLAVARALGVEDLATFRRLLPARRAA
jgi:putative peptidoglycan lipid II flippase